MKGTLSKQMGKVAFALYSCEDLGNKGKKMIKIMPVWFFININKDNLVKQ